MYVPMLADEVQSDSQLRRLLTSDRWAAEQKLDGHRVMFVVTDGVATPLNRRGEPFRQVMSRHVIEELSDPDVFREGQTWVLDGEFLNGRYWVFDLVDTPHEKLGPHTPLRERRAALEAIFAAWAPFHVSLVPHVVTTAGKQHLLDAVTEAGGEGVMFKDLDAPYMIGEVGKPFRSTQLLKHKLWAEADVIVTAPHPEGKRSVEIAVFDDGELVGVGSVSMTERNLLRAPVGSVITVKYLYRGAQGHLYQPAFRAVRTDKDPYECLITQLKPVQKDVLSISER